MSVISVVLEFAKQSDFVFGPIMPPVGTNAILRMIVSELPVLIQRRGAFVLSIPESHVLVDGPCDLGQPFMQSFKVKAAADGRAAVMVTGICSGGGAPDNNFLNSQHYSPAP
jgi:hypothetical protein